VDHLSFDLEMDMFHSNLLRLVVNDCLCKPFNLLLILEVNKAVYKRQMDIKQRPSYTCVGSRKLSCFVLLKRTVINFNF